MRNVPAAVLGRMAEMSRIGGGGHGREEEKGGGGDRHGGSLS